MDGRPQYPMFGNRDSAATGSCWAARREVLWEDSAQLRTRDAFASVVRVTCVESQVSDAMNPMAGVDRTSAVTQPRFPSHVFPLLSQLGLSFRNASGRPSPNSSVIPAAANHMQWIRTGTWLGPTLPALPHSLQSLCCPAACKSPGPSLTQPVNPHQSSMLIPQVRQHFPECLF